jgi:hypothetical protein
MNKSYVIGVRVFTSRDLTDEEQRALGDTADDFENAIAEAIEDFEDPLTFMVETHGPHASATA